MQIVVDMDGGAYVLGDLLAMLGRHPGDVLEVTLEGERLVVAVPRAEAPSVDSIPVPQA